MKFRNISLAGLCAIESVDRTGSLTLASEDQGVSLVAISTSIKRVEEELGLQFVGFEDGKSRNKVATKDGQILASAVRDCHMRLSLAFLQLRIGDLVL